MRKFKTRRRLKKTTKQYITVCLIALIVTAASATAITLRIINNITTASNNKVEEYRSEMELNKREVYIVKENIKKGESLAENILEKKYVYATQPQESYINSDDIGKTTLIDISAGTQALKTMVTDVYIDQDLREAEYNTIMISSNIKENDIVDIRIVFPNGEDYVVLSKKVMNGYPVGSISCFLWINEEELIRMQSAIVDAYLYTGTYLYTTKYIEPNLQEETVVNYEPSIEAIKLIQENPNILETATNELSVMVRKALENRLSASINKDIRENQWEIEDNFIFQDFPKTPSEDESEIIENGNTSVYEDLIESETGTPQDITINEIHIKEEIKDALPEVTDDTYFPELGKSGSDLGYEINGVLSWNDLTEG